MNFKILHEYEISPSSENGYDNNQLICLANGKAIGINSNSVNGIYNFQIFEESSIRLLNLSKTLFRANQGISTAFIIDDNPVFITNNLFSIVLNKELTDYKCSKIINSELVFSKKELVQGIGSMGKYTGNSLTNESIISISYSSLYRQNEMIKLRFDTKNQEASFIPISTQKRGLFRKKNIYRATLNLEEFPHRAGYPIWSKPPIIYSTLNMGKNFIIYSCGDRITKGSGLSYNCISIIDKDLKLKEHLFVEDHDARKDGKLWGRFGIFTTGNKYVIVTPKYSKKVEYNWMGNQKVYNLNERKFEEIQFPKGYKKYNLIDINSNYAIMEYWNRKSRTKHLAIGEIAYP